MKIEKITKAIIPVAGLGTRFLPYTKTIPKGMLPILNKPVIQYIVEEAIAAGIEEIIFITAENNSPLIKYFQRDYELEHTLTLKNKHHLAFEISEIGKNIKFSFIQQKKPLGLGDAVLLAKHQIGNEPFALLLGDDVLYNKNYPVIRQLIDQAILNNGSVLGLKQVPKADLESYGVVEFAKKLTDQSFLLKSVVEKPHPDEAPSNYSIIGRYILTPTIFKYLSEHHIDAKTNEIQITDSILKVMSEEAVYGFEFKGQRYDMGSKLGFVKAQIEYAMRDTDQGFRELIVDCCNDINLNHKN